MMTAIAIVQIAELDFWELFVRRPTITTKPGFPLAPT